MFWVRLFALLSKLHAAMEWLALHCAWVLVVFAILDSMLGAIDKVLCFLRIRELTPDDRGAVMTEYVVILGTVSIGLAVAVFGLGPAIVDGYARARGIVLMPYP